MRAALVPGPGTAARIAHLGKPKAFPGAARWKLALADLAGKLPRQHSFLTALIAPEDDRAKLATAAIVSADYLLLGEDGSAEECVGRRGHLGAPAGKMRPLLCGADDNQCKRIFLITTAPRAVVVPHSGWVKYR